MKNIPYFIIVLFFSICLLTCSKDDPVIIYEPGAQTDGWATGLKGGQEWEASGFARRHEANSSLIGIDFVTYNKEGSIRESYATNEIPLKIGYTIVKYGFHELGDNYAGGSAGMLGSDGDLLEASYRTNNDKEGFIKITSVDSISNRVAGEFELFFIQKTSYNDSHHLDKLELTEGRFEVRIIN